VASARPSRLSLPSSCWNHTAYDGFFFRTMSWIISSGRPSRPASLFLIGFASSRGFEIDNFRPVGHLYFALMGRAFGLDFPPYMTPIFAIHLLNALAAFPADEEARNRPLERPWRQARGSSL